MLSHFFKTALGNFHRNRLYTMINILGLSLGLTVSMIIFYWVYRELNYDKFNRDYRRIYRLVIEDENESGRASVSPAIKTQLLDNIPEVEYSTRIFRAGFLGEKTKVSYRDKVFTDNEIIYADPDFFKIFSFPSLKGNSQKALQSPDAVILTEETARRYFGDDDPLGKFLQLSDKKLIQVASVIKNLPPDSHFHFDMLISMKGHPWGTDLSGCGLGSCWVFNTYLKVFPGVAPETILARLQSLLPEYLSPDEIKDYKNIFRLQPLADIHLRSNLDGELSANNDIRYVYLFSSIAVLVLLIAGINYINLTTAGSFTRSRETGIRKVLGALKSQLLVQFLGESLLITFAAGILAFILIEILRPVISSYSGFNISGIYGNPSLWLAGIGLASIFGIIAGLFPSLVLSSAKPAVILKILSVKADKKGRLRSGLVVFQFCISIILLVCTGTIDRQLNFMKNKKLGYRRDHILVLHIGYPELVKNYLRLKNDLLADSRILAAAAVSQLPVNILTGEYIDTPGNKFPVTYVSIDPDFFRTMDIGIIAGRDRIENLTPGNYSNRFVLNKNALQEIGWNADEALGKEIIIRHGNMKPGPVIGISEDFNFQSLHYPLKPLVYEFVPSDYEYLLIRIRPGDVTGTIGFIQSTWKEYSGGIPFEYSFLDQDYARLYESEMNMGKLFFLFALISVLVAMLGLFGLSSYAAYRRTREIGIRKVFGATPWIILRLMSGDFTRLVILSLIISTPPAYWLIHRWLQAFAYQSAIHPLILVLPGLLVWVIALLTVGYHSIRASRTDPVKTLRYE